MLLFHTPEGKDFKNRKFAYAPVTIGNKTYGSTAEEFKEFLAKAQNKEVGYDWGHSSAVVALFPDGKAAMMDFTSVKTPDSYLYNIIVARPVSNKDRFKNRYNRPHTEFG